MAIRKTVFLCAVVGVVMVLHGAESLHLQVNGVEKSVSHYIISIILKGFYKVYIL